MLSIWIFKLDNFLKFKIWVDKSLTFSSKYTNFVILLKCFIDKKSKYRRYNFLFLSHLISLLNQGNQLVNIIEKYKFIRT